MKSPIPVLFLLFFASSASAQSTLRGRVRNASSQEPILGASITIKGKPGGATTDNTGAFILPTDAVPPFNIVVYSVGLARQEFAVTNVIGQNTNFVRGLTVHLFFKPSSAVR